MESSAYCLTAERRRGRNLVSVATCSGPGVDT
jgi:hypothetical protein